MFILTVLYEGVRLVREECYFRQMYRHIAHICTRAYRRYNPRIRASAVFEQDYAQEAKK